MKLKLFLFALCLGAALLGAQEQAPQALQGQGLPRLAVVDFAVNVETAKIRQDAVAIRNAVQSNFAATGQYDVIARAEIDQLLQNQQIALSAISSQESLKKLQLAKVSYIITGTVDAMDNDYSVAINILDVANGRVTHSAVDLMGSGSRDIFNGVNTLVRDFMAGLRSEGETVVSAGTARQERASAAAANTETGIRVRTNIAGALYFQNEETATLWDNDEYLIAITRPGTYTVKMIFGNGQTSSRTIVIQGRGIVDAQFGLPPAPRNLRAGTAAADSVTLSWDGGGTGIRYKVYYHTENNPQMARASGVAVSGTTNTVRNLTSNMDYYFWISAVDGSLEGEKSAALTAKTFYALGGRGLAGGWIFYDKGRVTDGWRFLEAAPADLDYAQWGAYGTNLSGMATEVGTGKRNTQVIVEYLRGTGESGRAAQLCTAYRGGGYSDWFLPSKDELDLMYKNLKQKGLGNFLDLWYWSSSQFNYNHSWVQNFGDGSQDYYYKNLTYSVRCVRAF